MSEDILKSNLNLTTQMPSIEPQQTVDLSAATGMNYNTLSQDKDAANTLAVNQRLDIISKTPSVMKFYQKQQNVDLTIKHLDELVKRSKFIQTRKPDYVGIGEAPIGDVAVSEFRRSLESMRLGEARNEGDLLEIEKRENILKDLPTYETGAFKGAIGGLSSIAGSMVYAAPELIRNEALFWGATTAATIATGGAALVPLAGMKIVEKGVTFFNLVRATGKVAHANKMVRIGKNLLRAEAIAESTAKSETGNAYHEIMKANPAMDHKEVRNRAEAVGLLNGIVEAAGWSFGVPQLAFPAIKLGLGKVIKEGVIKPTLATSKPFLRKLSSNILKAGFITVEELSEEKMQGLITDTAKEVEGEMKNRYSTLVKSSVSDFVDDGLNLINPLTAPNERNKQFLGETKNLANALFFSSLVGITIKNYSRAKFSNGEQIDKTSYEENIDNLGQAEKEVGTLVDRIKAAKETDADGALSKENPAANNAFNIEIDEAGGKVAMQPEDFYEMSERVLQDENVSEQTVADFKELEQEAIKAEKENRKMDIPYSKYASIFQPNGEVFQDSLDKISTNGDTLSANEIKNEQERLIETSEEIRDLTEEDLVYNTVRSSLAEDTKITEREKEDVAITAQLLVNTLSSIRKEPMTPSAFWSEYGATFEISKDERCIVEKVKDVVLGKGELQQDKRGSYDAGKRLVKVFKDGDATTFLHEFGGHYFLGEVERAIYAGEANEQWVKNYEQIRKWTGAKEGSLFDLEINREANEKFVAGFEKYLAEGKAPTSALADVFARMADLFMRTYVTLKNVGVPINKEMRKIYGEMFAAYEDIQKANKANRNFTVPKPKGISERFYQAYISDEVAGTKNAQRKLFDERVKISEKMKTDEMKSFIAKKTEEAYNALSALPVYKAKENASEFKLSIDELKALNIKTSEVPKKYKTSEGGVDPQVMADNFGYESVQEYVEAISETPEIGEAVSEYVDAHVKQKLASEGFAKLPFKSAVNENYFKAFVKKAIMAGGRNENEAASTEKATIKSAIEAFNNSKLKDAVKFDKWRSALQKQSDLAHRSLLHKDEKASYKGFIAAAHAHIQSLMSTKAYKKLKSFDRFRKKYNGSTEVRKNLGQDNYDAIVSVMNNFGIAMQELKTDKTVDQHIDSFVGRMVDDIGLENTAQLNNFKELLVKGGDLQDMPYKDFVILLDALKMMEASSKMSTKLIVEGQAIEEQKVIDSILGSRVINKIDSSNADSISSIYSQFFVKTLAVTPIFMKEAFGSYFTEKLLLPLKAGFDSSSAMVHELRARTANIILKHDITFSKKKNFYIDGIGSFNNEAVMMMALNIMSNPHNRANLYKTIAVNKNNNVKAELTEVEIDAINKIIPSQYWEAASDMLEIFKELYPRQAEAFKTRNGYSMGKVESETFVAPNGKSYTGGYFPAPKTTAAKSVIEGATLSLNNNFSTNKIPSFGKDRTEAITGDLDLTTHMMMKTFYDISTEIHVLQPFNAVGRLLNNHQRELKSHIGDVAYNSIHAWHRNSITPDYVSSKGLSWLDGVQKVFIMGGSIPKGIVQLFGFIPARSLLGSEFLDPEISRVLSSPLSVMKTAKSKSLYMRDRYERIEQVIFGMPEGAWDSIPEMMGKMESNKLQAVRETFMYAVKYGDAVASTIVWNAQFNKSIADGKTEKTAIMQADDMVRQTQGDFSSYTRPEAFKGFLRLFSPFVSYFVNMGSNIFSLSVSNQKRKLAHLVFTMVIFQPILEAMLREAFGDEDDEASYLERVAKTSVLQSVGGIGNMLLPLGGVGSSAATYLVSGKDYSGSAPFGSTIKGLVGAARDMTMATGKALGVEEFDDKEYSEYAESFIFNLVGKGMGILPKSSKELPEWVKQNLEGL